MAAQQRVSSVRDPSAMVAVVGTLSGMLLAFTGAFLPWYEYPDVEDSTVSGLDSGGPEVIILVVAAVLALTGLLLDSSRNRWLIGATFTISAVLAAELSPILTLDGVEVREGAWFGFIGAGASALSSAAAFAYGQLELRRVRAADQLD